MIAARFRLVGWVAGCAGAALLCYMASQSVAAERSALTKVDGEIAATRIEIDRLETEITARSRAGQVERWNNVLALQAARPAQYAASGVQLASMAGGRRLPLDPAIVAAHGAVTNVSYQPAVPAPAPAAPAPVAPAVVVAAPKIVPAVHVVADRPAAHVQPLLHQASFVRPAPSRLGDDLPGPIYDRPAAKPEPARADKPKPRAADRVADAAPAKPQSAKPRFAKAERPAKLEAGLLPSDLGQLIAAERKPKAKHAL